MQAGESIIIPIVIHTTKMYLFDVCSLMQTFLVESSRCLITYFIFLFTAHFHAICSVAHLIWF